MTAAETGAADHVRVTRTEHTVEIVLNRPGKKNALTRAMYTAMAVALDEAEADPTVRSVLLAAEGSAFCAGNDLHDFAANLAGDEQPPVWRFLDALASATVPVLAAVQGPAVGIGATMLLHCDYVVATEDAMLQYPFVNRALVPEAGSSLLLPRVVGYLRAAEIMLTGAPVSASRARDLGLVTEVVPAGDERRAAADVAAALRAQPPAALRLTKSLLRDDTPGLNQRITAELELFAQRLQSPEFAEAVAAFMQKRPADFDSVTS